MPHDESDEGRATKGGCYESANGSIIVVVRSSNLNHN